MGKIYVRARGVNKLKTMFEYKMGVFSTIMDFEDVEKVVERLKKDTSNGLVSGEIIYHDEDLCTSVLIADVNRYDSTSIKTNTMRWRMKRGWEEKVKILIKLNKRFNRGKYDE